MKKILCLSAVIVLVSFTAGYQPTPFQQLTVLAGGTWVMNTKTGTLCEEWKRAYNILLTGRSYKTQGKDTTIMERVQLSQRGVEVYYTPTAVGQNDDKPVPFKLSEATGNSFIFSNPDHDFPQRIGYEFVSKDSLHAWIEGKYNGKEMKKEFYYRRVR
ncbi:MAG: DUF6265 family protein [Sediminibacterium sp.]